MKLIDFRKYFFPNLLSFKGYFALLFTLYIVWIYNPLDAANVAKYANDPESAGFDSALYYTFAVFYQFCLSVACFIFFLIEFFIRRRNKSEFSLLEQVPDWLKIPYSIAFWIGIFCATPIVGLCIYFWRMSL